jgi:hypothetical protein
MVIEVNAEMIEIALLILLMRTQKKLLILKFLENRSVLRMEIISTLQIAWQLMVFDGLSVDGVRTRL